MLVQKSFVEPEILPGTRLRKSLHSKRSSTPTFPSSISDVFHYRDKASSIRNQVRIKNDRRTKTHTRCRYLNYTPHKKENVVWFGTTANDGGRSKFVHFGHALSAYRGRRGQPGRRRPRASPSPWLCGSPATEPLSAKQPLITHGHRQMFASGLFKETSY